MASDQSAVAHTLSAMDAPLAIALPMVANHQSDDVLAAKLNPPRWVSLAIKVRGALRQSTLAIVILRLSWPVIFILMICEL